VSSGADSVDIFIRELDKWSIIPKGAISASSYTVDLTDKNFIGLGHEFQNVFYPELYSRKLFIQYKLFYPQH
jgi:hypothetical protein